MANTNRSGEREAYWRDVVARFRTSGLSVRAFCRREKLVETAFYFWRRTLAERDGKLPTKSRPRQRPRGRHRGAALFADRLRRAPPTRPATLPDERSGPPPRTPAERPRQAAARRLEARRRRRHVELTSLGGLSSCWSVGDFR